MQIASFLLQHGPTIPTPVHACSQLTSTRPPFRPQLLTHCLSRHEHEFRNPFYNRLLMSSENLTTSEWNSFIQSHTPTPNLLQASQWGDLKSQFGWGAIRLVARKDGAIEGGAQVLFKSLPMGISRMAYIPKGPTLDWTNANLRSYMLDLATEFALARNSFVLKIEPDLPDTPENHAMLTDLGFQPSPQTIQPPNTIELDLSGTADEILARMKQKTRYNIRLSAKKGVTTRIGTAADLSDFHALNQITGERDSFGLHSPKYYETVYDLFAATDQVALIFAEYEAQPLATVMAFALGDRAWYLYGASSNEERNRMPAYAAQWAAIQWAKARGCTRYDLVGIPDASTADLEEHFQTRKDGLWPVYRFKRGFGGTAVRSVGAWDKPLSKFIYNLYLRRVARKA